MITAMPSLKEIVVKRLAEMDVSAIEAAQRAGLERTFIRDIVEDRKKSVRADKLPSLAVALGVDMVALSEGKLLVVEVKSAKPGNGAAQPIERLWDLFNRVRETNDRDLQFHVIRLVEDVLGPDQALPRKTKSRETRTKPAS